jgi:hypothetical protein
MAAGERTGEAFLAVAVFFIPRPYQKSLTKICHGIVKIFVGKFSSHSSRQKVGQACGLPEVHLMTILEWVSLFSLGPHNKTGQKTRVFLSGKGF